MRCRRFVVGVVLLSSSAATAACGLVAAFEPLEYFDASDAATDLDVAVSDARPGDDDARADSSVADAEIDATDAGVDALVSCYERLDGSFEAGVIFCDDFERDSDVGAGWGQLVSVNGGAVATSAQAATSGTRSLLVTIPSGASSGEKSAYLRTKTISVTPLVFEADVFVESGPPAGPSYPSNGFSLGRFTVTSGTFKEVFARVESAGQIDPFFFVPDTPMPLSQGTWLHLSWTVTGTGSNAQSVSLFEKANPATVVTRITDVPSVPKDFWIGARTDANLGPVKLYVDDVVIHQ